MKLRVCKLCTGLLLCCLLIIGTPGFAQSNGEQSVQLIQNNQVVLPSVTQLSSLLEELRAQFDLPSLRAALRTDRAEVAAAVGYADVENQIPVTTDISMPGGSTGKSFVATLAMLLIERDILQPSDPISLYVGQTSWFKALEGGGKITVEHLLTHSSGLPDHVDDTDFALSLLWRRITGGNPSYRPVELVEFVLDDGLLFSPGSDYSYTDTGYLVLGLVIEAAASAEYYSLLQEEIITPYNLAARPALSASMPNVSVGYIDDSLLMMMAGLGGRNMHDGVMDIDPATEWTGGGLMTTPTVLANFYHKLANGDIVRPESYLQMTNAGHTKADRSWHYGYGLFVDGPIVGHGGWFPGYATNVRYFGEDDLTIAMQTNSDKEFDQWQVLAALRDLVRTAH